MMLIITGLNYIVFDILLAAFWDLHLNFRASDAMKKQVPIC